MTILYHIMYTDAAGAFHAVERPFPSFAAAEVWVAATGATYWEIGV